MRSFIVVAFAAPLLYAAAARAQKFEYGKYEEVKDVTAPEWHATAEAGVVFTTGSSETLTATGGIKASRKTGNNKLELSASGAYAKSGVRLLLDRNGNGLIDDETEIVSAETLTAEMIASKLRYDRFLTAGNSLYVAALAGRDTPAGKELVVGGQLGYSRSLHKSKVSQTLAEVGYDYSREDQSSGDPVDIHSARGFLGHKATMTEGADLDASLEALTNINTLTLPTGRSGGAFRDTRVNLKVAVSAKIGLNLAFQMSVEARYDHRPGPLPVKNLAMGFIPEAAAFDTIMKASFIYTFVAAKPKEKPKAAPAPAP